MLCTILGCAGLAKLRIECAGLLASPAVHALACISSLKDLTLYGESESGACTLEPLASLTGLSQLEALLVSHMCWQDAQLQELYSMSSTACHV